MFKSLLKIIPHLLGHILGLQVDQLVIIFYSSLVAFYINCKLGEFLKINTRKRVGYTSYLV